MRLFEYMVKEIFKENKIPILPGKIASSYNEILKTTEEIGFPFVLKAQLPYGGRGKAGLIQKINNQKELKEKYQQMKITPLKGLIAEDFLIESYVKCLKEYYISIIMDYNNGGPVLLLGSEGGIEVENNKNIIKIPVNHNIGVLSHDILKNCQSIDRNILRKIIVIAKKMYKVFEIYDATLVEINPLGLNDKNELIALDGKMTVDDSSLYRQPKIKECFKKMKPKIFADELKHEYKLDFVEIDGDIGLISGGAGMTMAAMDLIRSKGGKPACFLDCSNNPTVEGYGKTFSLLNNNPKISAILINIFGGLTEMDKVAEAIVTVLKNVKTNKPVVVRLEGTKSDKAKEILKNNGICSTDSFIEAVEKVVKEGSEKS